MLVLTNYDSDGDILSAVEAGASGYLLKDAPPHELLAAVRAAGCGRECPGPRHRRPAAVADAEPAGGTVGRELKVLQLVADGATNSAIAARLHITEATVKSHLVHVFTKLGVTSRTAAVSRTPGRTGCSGRSGSDDRTAVPTPVDWESDPPRQSGGPLAGASGGVRGLAAGAAVADGQARTARLLRRRARADHRVRVHRAADAAGGSGRGPHRILQEVDASLGLSLSMRMDTLGWLMALIVTGVGALVMIYCRWYFADTTKDAGAKSSKGAKSSQGTAGATATAGSARKKRVKAGVGMFAASLLAFAGAMYGLVLTDDLIVLVMFWRCTSMSYLLIGFYHARGASRRAALQALLVTTLGGSDPKHDMPSDAGRFPFRKASTRIFAAFKSI